MFQCVSVYILLTSCVLVLAYLIRFICKYLKWCKLTVMGIHNESKCKVHLIS